MEVFIKHIVPKIIYDIVMFKQKQGGNHQMRWWLTGAAVPPNQKIKKKVSFIFNYSAYFHNT